jgi:6-phosphofructokinase 1
MGKCIGILTSGGDCQGLNAALRSVGKSAQYGHDMTVIGFRDGFRGLMENRYERLEGSDLSGILTVGGTILGTSRDKPHKMNVGGKILDMTDAMVETYEKHNLDCLICVGGGGTHKNALKLMEKGLKIITLPKTIDNDLACTDASIGFDTALGVATDAIDRLHSTASSHHRIMVVEIMGHRTGWLTLGAGVAAGADVILIPEIPYNVRKVSDAIKERRRGGKHFSIVAVAEGALTTEEADLVQKTTEKKISAKNKKDKDDAEELLQKIHLRRVDHAVRLSQELEELTSLESRVTILGYTQRGGAPSATDRLLATRLGAACIEHIKKSSFGVMMAVKGDKVEGVPIEDVAGKRKDVPKDHPWVRSARGVGTCMGD